MFDEYNEYTAVVLVQMLIIGALVIYQKGEGRKIVAFLFASMVLIHDQIFSAIYNSDSGLAWYVDDTPYIYHLSAALVSLLIIEAIARLNEPPELAGDIQWISVMAIALNLIGWGMYKFGVHNEILINSAFFMILYGWTIAVLLMGEPKHVGNIRFDTRLYTVHPRNMARNIISANN
jgi:hypothetical protein